MTKALSILAAALVALIVQGAQARERHSDRRLGAVAIGVGAASTAGYFAINNWSWKWGNGSGLTQAAAWGLTTVGCMAVSPMVATAVLNRPLTLREGDVLAASCILPIVGGWLVNQAFDAHPEWDPASAPPARHPRHYAKK